LVIFINSIVSESHGTMNTCSPYAFQGGTAMTIYLYHLIQDERVCYVGVTTNISARKNFWKRTKPPHTFEIIDTFTDKEEAGIAEQYHIAGYNTFKKGWNKSIGGETLLIGENHPNWTGFDKKEYDQRPEVKERTHKRSQTPEYKAYQKKYRERPEVKARRKEYKQTPKYKAYLKEYYERHREK
tara:strand:+ start:199 stop:750 length:552 start_codon:yes stop_codon:yes gene_type:complete